MNRGANKNLKADSIVACCLLGFTRGISTVEIPIDTNVYNHSPVLEIHHQNGCSACNTAVFEALVHWTPLATCASDIRLHRDWPGTRLFVQ